MILSFYYPPDLSAGSFRTSALAQSLHILCPTANVTVITTIPNRYGSYDFDPPRDEKAGNISIVRLKIRPHNGSLIGQSLSFIEYAWKTNKLLKGSDYNLVYATSSRLMTAVLGAWISRRLESKLYLDIRDIFLDSLPGILPMRLFTPIIWVLTLLERWTIETAAIVNLVSPGFSDYFIRKYPNTNFTFHTNGIDEEFLNPTLVGSSNQKKLPFTVLYAGNFGLAQSLDLIVPPIANQTKGLLNFKLIGDGNGRESLIQSLSKSVATNVEVLNPMPRERLLIEYKKADILFLHLNSHEAFKKVLPSKIFEYGASGKPIWAGLDGFSARFVEDELNNAVVFKPCDVDEALEIFKRLEIRDRERRGFIKKFSRKRLSKKMAADLLKLCGGD